MKKAFNTLQMGNFSKRRLSPPLSLKSLNQNYAREVSKHPGDGWAAAWMQLQMLARQALIWMQFSSETFSRMSTDRRS